jgi:hypothetical protein
VEAVAMDQLTEAWEVLSKIAELALLFGSSPELGVLGEKKRIGTDVKDFERGVKIIPSLLDRLVF